MNRSERGSERAVRIVLAGAELAGLAAGAQAVAEAQTQEGSDKVKLAMAKMEIHADAVEEIRWKPGERSKTTYTFVNLYDKEGRQESTWFGYVDNVPLGDGRTVSYYYDAAGRQMNQNEVKQLAEAYTLRWRDLPRSQVMRNHETLIPGQDFLVTGVPKQPVVSADQAGVGGDGDAVAMLVPDGEPRRQDGGKPKPEEQIEVASLDNYFLEAGAVEVQPVFVPASAARASLLGELELLEVQIAGLDTKGGTIYMNGDRTQYWYFVPGGNPTNPGDYKAVSTYGELEKFLLPAEVVLVHWSAEGGVTVDQLPASLRAEIEAKPYLVLHIPGTGIVVDFSKAPNWLANKAVYGYGEFYITPISAVQDKISRNFLPGVREAIRTDNDQVVYVLLPDGTGMDLPIDPNNLPPVKIEIRDYKTHGRDLAAYAGNVPADKLRGADFDRVAMAETLTRTYDPATGVITVRAYWDEEGMYPNVGGLDASLFDWMAFAYSEDCGAMIAPTEEAVNGILQYLPIVEYAEFQVGDPPQALKIGIIMPEAEAEYFGLGKLYDLPFGSEVSQSTSYNADEIPKIKVRPVSGGYNPSDARQVFGRGNRGGRV